MHSLIVDCTGFLLQFAVYALNADGEVYQRNYMPVEDIAGYAASNRDIKSIKLSGPSDYCENLKNDIKARLALEYAINDIEVEVM